jgi:hypothetical protein
MGRRKFQGNIIFHGDNILKFRWENAIGRFPIPKDEVVSRFNYYRIQAIVCIIY